MPQLCHWCCNLDLLPQDSSWEEMKEETRSDGLQSEQKPGSHRSVSLSQCKQISACSQKPMPLTQPNCAAAPFAGTALPPRSPSSCPNCQGLTKDNPSWRTLVFWNLRQLLGLPADLCWEACWEQTHIYWDLALHFSEAAVPCSTIHHSLKKLPQADSVKGKYCFPHVIFN